MKTYTGACYYENRSLNLQRNGLHNLFEIVNSYYKFVEKYFSDVPPIGNVNYFGLMVLWN